MKVNGSVVTITLSHGGQFVTLIVFVFFEKRGGGKNMTPQSRLL